MTNQEAIIKPKTMRDSLQQGIYKVINPFVRMLIKLGLTPNAITTIGLILNIGVAVIFIVGAEEGHRGDFTWVGWAGGLILFAGLFDMLDGQVARLGNMSSRFGAMYDSVLDRYSELIMFLGICYYLVAHHYFLSSLFAFIALIGSMMVSYTRARAEGMGVECKGGLMQRPERVITIGVTALACGITAGMIGGDYKLYIPGIPFHVFETMTIFTLPLTVLAVMTNITAFGRLREAKKALDAQDAQQKSGRTSTFIALAMIATTALTALQKPVQAAPANNNKTSNFPIPPVDNKLLFYVQRTSNANTIMYELNLKADGTLDEENPVHPYWIRYTEQGQKAELNYIQRKYAYGVKTRPMPNNNGNKTWEVLFVSYKKKPLYLSKAADHKYHIFTLINNKMHILNSVWVQIEGGSFWVPNVVYVELKGTDAATGKSVVERFEP